MARYLVTGGAGFIGSNLVEALLADGHEVVVLDDFSTGREENFTENSRLRVVRADICDGAALDDALKGVSAVFHEAALGSVARSVDDPAATNRANVEGSLAVLDAARGRGVRRVVLAGSSSVYGDSEELPKIETMRLTPVSPYAASKAAMEHYAAAYAACYGLETVTLRYFNVYGPRQRPDSLYAAVVPAFVSCMLGGKAATIHGDGEQTRDFTYVGDVVRANVLAASAPAERVAGKSYNVGGSERISIRRLYGEIARICGREDLAPTFGPARQGDVRHTLADTGRAAVDLAWRPQTALPEGLARTVRWFRERGS